MEYRKIGKWGARVSEIALGSWLTYGGSVDRNESIKQVLHAFESGINFFDTANVYAGGESEVVVGKAISQLKRDDVFLATKVFFPMGSGPNDRGLSRKHVTEQCNASLKRLNVDYIDLYQCHRYDPDTPAEELVATMDILTRQGKIFYWGVSEWPAEKIQEVVDMARQLGAPPPVSNQPCYNMLTRNIEAEVIPVSERNGIAQVVFSPLAQGVLTGKYKPNQPHPKDSRAASERDGVFLRGRGLLEYKVLEQVENLEKLARKNNMLLSQMALAWCLRHGGIASVIIGATKSSQIDENIKAAGTRLPVELLTEIETILSQVPVNR